MLVCTRVCLWRREEGVGSPRARFPCLMREPNLGSPQEQQAVLTGKSPLQLYSRPFPGFWVLNSGPQAHAVLYLLRQLPSFSPAAFLPFLIRVRIRVPLAFLTGELQAAAGGTQQPLHSLDNSAFPCVLTLIPQHAWLLALFGAYPEFHSI